jgi:acyl carrier protein
MTLPLEPKIESVRKWLEARKPEFATIDPDLDLIENRVIDSLAFTEFLFFLEELIDREIDPTPQIVASFRTLRTIERDILDGNPGR